MAFVFCGSGIIMKTEEEIDEILNRVRDRTMELFKSGMFSDVKITSGGNIETPIQMFNPDGSICAWYVGITIGDRLVGYMQFTDELVLMSFSVYGKDGLPKTWLNPSAILDLAKMKSEAGDELMEPFLSYDRNPSRIAWAIRYKDKSGKIGTIFVAGEYVYKVLEGQDRPGRGIR